MWALTDSKCSLAFRWLRKRPVLWWYGDRWWLYDDMTDEKDPWCVCLHQCIRRETAMLTLQNTPCGTLNENVAIRSCWIPSPQLVNCLRTRRGGHVGGTASLEGGLRFSKTQVISHGSLLLLPVDSDVELSALSLALCLPAYCHVTHHDDNRLNLWNCKPAPIKCFLFYKKKVTIVMMFLHSNEILIKIAP